MLGARQPSEDFGVGEGKSGQAQLYVGRDADVNATEGSTVKVLGYTVRGHEDLVQVTAARATAAIHLDLPGDVGAVGCRNAAHGREGLRVHRLPKAVNVGHTAVVRALHFNVKGRPVAIVQVHGQRVGAVNPLAGGARGASASSVSGAKSAAPNHCERGHRAGRPTPARKRRAGRSPEWA